MRLIIYIAILFVLSLFFICNNPNATPNGGYEFVTPKDTFDKMNFRLPMKSTMTKMEVLMAEGFSRYLKVCYEIDNISLQPSKENIFRFVFLDAFGKAIVIELKSSKLLVKGLYYNSLDEGDTTKSLEYKNRALLRKLMEYHSLNIDSNIIYRDEIIKKLKKMGFDKEEVLSKKYYYDLKNIAESYYSKATKKIDTIINLSEKHYEELVQHINQSGYWRLESSDDCGSNIADGIFYFLEANAYGKYNYVSSTGCDEMFAFQKACQELINATPLKKEIKVYHHPN